MIWKIFYYKEFVQKVNNLPTYIGWYEGIFLSFFSIQTYTWPGVLFYKVALGF